MGKVKKTRQKYHVAVSKDNLQNKQIKLDSSSENALPILSTNDNIFAGLDISFNSLKKNLQDDTRSIKSFKSTKSDLGSRISKKNKIKLRHDILLQKVDTVSQFKKQQKERKKRKNNAIIGDTNALHDALPSLDSLLKTRDFKISVPQPPKKKGVAKQSKRKKSIVEGVNLYKNLLKNKQFQNDPLKIINDVIKQRVQSGNI